MLLKRRLATAELRSSWILPFVETSGNIKGRQKNIPAYTDTCLLNTRGWLKRTGTQQDAPDYMDTSETHLSGTITARMETRSGRRDYCRHVGTGLRTMTSEAGAWRTPIKSHAGKVEGNWWNQKLRLQSRRIRGRLTSPWPNRRHSPATLLGTPC